LRETFLDEGVEDAVRHPSFTYEPGALQHAEMA
jgi:hypothetical protein